MKKILIPFLLAVVPYAFAVDVMPDFVDPRDGQTYKTVQIGSQRWFAENLRYKLKGSYCYDNRDYNCSRYGRLYDWSMAMRMVGYYNTHSIKKFDFSKVKGKYHDVCPKGWRLPDSSDFRSLFASAKEVRSPAAMALKAVDGWADYKGESMNGTDDLGFSLLPGGYMYEDSLGNVEYRDEGVGTMLVDNDPLIISVLGGKASFYLAKFVCNQMDVIIHDGIYYGYVRCVKD